MRAREPLPGPWTKRRRPRLGHELLETRLGCCLAVLLALVLAGESRAQLVLSEGTNFAVDVSPSGEELAIDLLGSLWLLEADGGDAELVTRGLEPARRPRWSPSGERLLFQSSSAFGSRIGLLTLADDSTRWLSDGRHFDQHPAWHPDGTRIVFSSERRDTGFDLWERDLPTDLAWRLTQRAGDETEPAWSPNGEDLAYIHHAADEWRLVLRRRGQPENDLVVSDQALAAPAWRPDGTLLTFLRREGREYRLDMVILSDPPVVHPLATGQDFFLSPVTWLDRERLIYAADGVIKVRNINAWKAREVPFRAEVRAPESRMSAAADRTLEVIDPPRNRIVVRAARLFDGMRPGYRHDLDIVIEGARITAIEPRRERTGTTVLDLGEVTVLPGFIDAWSSLPAGSQAEAGLELLSFGVTTVVASDAEGRFEAKLWETEGTPGPRLLFAAPASYRPNDKDARRPSLVTLPAAAQADRRLVRRWHERGVPVLAESWNVGFRIGADLFLGVDVLPASPRGFQYQDVRLAMGLAMNGGPLTMLSGLADAGTPGLSSLLHSRQAEHWSRPVELTRRYPALPPLAADSTRVAIGSKPNGLPPGLATHAEMRALAAAGLGADEILWAAGRNAARAIGLEDEIGRIAPGALADLVLIAGDPRERIADAINVVAVVRNGRFYSVAGLLDRAPRALPRQ